METQTTDTVLISIYTEDDYFSSSTESDLIDNEIYLLDQDIDPDSTPTEMTMNTITSAAYSHYERFKHLRLVFMIISHLLMMMCFILLFYYSGNVKGNIENILEDVVVSFLSICIFLSSFHYMAIVSEDVIEKVWYYFYCEVMIFMEWSCVILTSIFFYYNSSNYVMNMISLLSMSTAIQIFISSDGVIGRRPHVQRRISTCLTICVGETILLTVCISLTFVTSKTIFSVLDAIIITMTWLSTLSMKRTDLIDLINFIGIISFTLFSDRIVLWQWSIFICSVLVNASCNRLSQRIYHR